MKTMRPLSETRHSIVKLLALRRRFGADRLPSVMLVAALSILATGIAAVAHVAAVRAQVQSVQELIERAEHGDARAAFIVATAYASGRGVVQSDNEAARWFHKAAEEGLAEAQYNLGVLYVSGRGVGTDMAQAARWFEAAAEQGIAEAEYNVGMLYGTGQGVPRDDEVAAMWIRRAAGQGLARAQYNLAIRLEEGRGVPIDIEEAAMWYGEAASRGFEPAEDRLARLEAERSTQSASPATEQETSLPAKEDGTDELVLEQAHLPEVFTSPLTSESVKQPVAVPLDDRPRSIKGADWLRSLSPSHYTVQIASLESEERALAFISDLGATDDVAYFSSVKNGETRYAVLFGVYATMQEALDVAGSLPQKLQRSEPWVRNIGLIQKALSE